MSKVSNSPTLKIICCLKFSSDTQDATIFCHEISNGEFFPNYSTTMYACTYSYYMHT